MAKFVLEAPAENNFKLSLKQYSTGIIGLYVKNLSSGLENVIFLFKDKPSCGSIIVEKCSGCSPGITGMECESGYVKTLPMGG